MKINRKKLMESLEAVRPGLADKDLVEQSTSFAFRGGRVYSYNDQVAVSHEVELGIEGAVSAKELHGLLGKIKAEEVEIEATDKELRVSSGKKARAGIAFQTQIKLPLDQLSDLKEWRPLPDTFYEQLKLVLFSVGHDLTKPELTCVHIKANVLETCDNYRITQADIQPKVAGDEPVFPEELLIPADSCSQLARQIPTEFTVGGGWAHFRNRIGTIFSCRLAAVAYPDLSAFMAGEGRSFDLPKELPQMLDRAIVFSGENTDPMGTSRFAVTLSSGKIVVRGEGPSGWFEEEDESTYAGDPVRFHIQPTFLREIALKVKDAQITDRVLKFAGDAFRHCCSVEILEEKTDKVPSGDKA